MGALLKETVHPEGSRRAAAGAVAWLYHDSDAGQGLSGASPGGLEAVS